MKNVFLVGLQVAEVNIIRSDFSFSVHVQLVENFLKHNIVFVHWVEKNPALALQALDLHLGNACWRLIAICIDSVIPGLALTLGFDDFTGFINPIFLSSIGVASRAIIDWLPFCLVIHVVPNILLRISWVHRCSSEVIISLRSVTIKHVKLLDFLWLVEIFGWVPLTTVCRIGIFCVEFTAIQAQLGIVWGSVSRLIILLPRNLRVGLEIYILLLLPLSIIHWLSPGNFFADLINHSAATRWVYIRAHPEFEFVVPWSKFVPSAEGTHWVTDLILVRLLHWDWGHFPRYIFETVLFLILWVVEGLVALIILGISLSAQSLIKNIGFLVAKAILLNNFGTLTIVLLFVEIFDLTYLLLIIVKKTAGFKTFWVVFIPLPLRNQDKRLDLTPGVDAWTKSISVWLLVRESSTRLNIWVHRSL